MNLELHPSVFPDHIRFDFTGNYDFLELMQHIEMMRDEATSADRKLALIDTRTTEGRMTESEKFFAGAKIAEVFGSKIKAAVIIAAGEVTKLGEMAAVNRGARFLVTENEAEAVEWLFTPAGNTAP